ncbi:aldo/keto reductase [Promicromonospora alba]|uniref:Aldo/keto reductase n=1 Tax=Promicromonospora alba TaxID=1616110 RepID=A0ABV9HNN6_9MICO
MSESVSPPERTPEPSPGGTFPLGKHTVSRIGYGAIQLPRLRDPADAQRVLRRALDLGVNHFDTADFYGKSVANEYLAQTLPADDDVLVVTKVGALRTTRGPVPMRPGQRPEELRKSVQDNLRSLNTDRLALVNMRRMSPDGGFPVGHDQRVDFDDQIAEMVAMRDEGLIGDIGLSAVSLKEVQRALSVGIACVQNPYSLVARKDEPLLTLCERHGIAWAPYFPLGGALPGLAKVTHEPAVQAIAQTVGATPAQVGLAWLLHHAGNVLLIPGTSSVDHLEQNVAAGEVRLDEDALARLDKLKPAAGIRGFVNRFRRP